MPAVEIVTTSEPELLVCVVQLAEQEVAFVEDQVKVEVLPNKTETGSADKLTIGVGVVGVGVFPPPLPPPQEAINKILAVIDNNFFIYICVII